jgi:hypothetical protein
MEIKIERSNETWNEVNGHCWKCYDPGNGEPRRYWRDDTEITEDEYIVGMDIWR